MMFNFSMNICVKQTTPGCGRIRTDSHSLPFPVHPYCFSKGYRYPRSSSGFPAVACPQRALSNLHQKYSEACAPRRLICRSAPAAEPLASSQPAQPRSGADFTLHCEDTGTSIHVFGVEHLSPQPHIGEWIIRNRPQAVVVETAMGPEHGSMAGNVIRCGDQVVDPTAGFFLRMFCQIGVTLQEFKEGDFTQSPLWNQVRSSYNGEQLAYIGAFATGAPLVFGDRPKDITYRRLFGMTTIPQLDQGFSYAAVQNYRTFLGLPPLPYDPDNLPVTEQIMMQEREAVMLKVVHQLCSNTLPQQRLAAGRPRDLALVVGSAHLAGVEYLWRSGRWREVVGSGGANHPLSASQLLATPRSSSDTHDDPQHGLRRGLMEAMLRLSVTKEVISDLESVLGPVPERQMQSYTSIQEVYGAPRMQLASLPRDMLKKLVEGLGCDFYEVLQPLRDIRPLNGGPGYSDDMVMYVRGLNFELE
ncbi:hypothetical protein Vretimale_19829 [Volvox reticuliferus]|uniref:Uncharacterized protein n=1 Tax=Volvox reticuliferus TaxID=1737510 RepID=A0A8J4CVM7_9CHLO|nr:hypothetical protein Vretifemale_18421 [Volvox reticuliferus]GIM17300.1 hypothetical protein Vretimale_19829 [Volvox reticuliferus]